MLARFKALKREIPYGRWAEFWKPTVQPVEGKVKKQITFCNENSTRPCVTVASPVGGPQEACEAVREALEKEIARIDPSVEVGRAKVGAPGEVKPFIGFPHRLLFYVDVEVEDVPTIVEETLVKGQILFEFVSVDPSRVYRPDVCFERETGLLGAVDETVSMVDVALSFLKMEEGLSCQKCIPCRQGMPVLLELVERIAAGEGTQADLAEVRELCELMDKSAHCEFARTSSRPVKSALAYFEDEFLARLKKDEG